MTKEIILPNAFCWTKMGTEAGQSLEAIITRKDMERELGDGVFFWGIGTALGQKIWNFIDSISKPFILFSPIKTKPKQKDVNPGKVFIWTSYIDRIGKKHTIPDHILLTSNGTVNNLKKKQHYALVCHKKRPLLYDEKWPCINWADLNNYMTQSKLGYSQVTAVVERKEIKQKLKNIHYDVLFGAELVDPYYIKLTDPYEMPNEILSIINNVHDNKLNNVSSWYKWLRSEIYNNYYLNLNII